MAKRSLEDIFNDDPLGLLDVEVKHSSQHDSENYLINGFNDIQTFFERTGRAPQLNESDRIEELRLATRLDTFRKNSLIIEKLSPFDKYQLLVSYRVDDMVDEKPPASIDEILNNDLLEIGSDDIFDIRNIPSSERTQSANLYTANSKPCEDFDRFQYKFEQVQLDLENKRRETGSIERISEIKAGQWFILRGMLAYVAEIGEKYEHRKGRYNARLRVIFSNKTESDLLLRSFGAALYKDRSARRIYGATEGPLFGGVIDGGDTSVGIVYVLKSLSQQTGIKEHREYLHKIGVTTGNVKARIASAENDPTYLLSAVEIAAEFKLYNMNPIATEKLLHKFFYAAQANIEIKDRFGHIVRPREWFFVTIKAVHDAVKAINENRILNVRYDHESGKIVEKNK